MSVSGQGSLPFHAGARSELTPPIRRTPPSQYTGTRLTHPGPAPVPGFDVTYALRRVISGSLLFVFPDHTCHHPWGGFSATLPSSRRESHPPALTDPDVNLSIHPARAVQSSERVPQSPVHEQPRGDRSYPLE